MVWRFHLFDYMPPQSVIRRVQIHQDAADNGEARLTFSSPDGVEKTDPYSSICATSRKSAMHAYDARLPGSNGRDILFDSTRDIIFLWKEDGQSEPNTVSSAAESRGSLQDTTPRLDGLDDFEIRKIFENIKNLALFTPE